MITIRPTLKSDADILCEIQKAAFLPIYEKFHDAKNPCLRGAEDITNRLGSPLFKYFTVLEDGVIVGGVLYRREGGNSLIDKLNPGEYYLTRIYIRPDMQRRGIGKKAILLCEKEFPGAVKFYVDFPKELEKNRKFYESAGFRSSDKDLESEPGLILTLYEKNAGE